MCKRKSHGGYAHRDCGVVACTADGGKQIAAEDELLAHTLYHKPEEEQYYLGVVSAAANNGPACACRVAHGNDGGHKSRTDDKTDYVVGDAALLYSAHGADGPHLDKTAVEHGAKGAENRAEQGRDHCVGVCKYLL